MDTAPVKAIALPAVYRANLDFQSHVPFQHSRTRVRRGFCTLVHSLTLGAHAQRGLLYLVVCVCVSVCLSVKSHLTSGASVRPENTVVYLAGNGG